MLQIKKLLFGFAAEMMLSGGLLSLFSLLILKMGVLSNGAAGTMAIAAGCVAIFIAAFLTAHWAGEKGLVHGLVLAGGYVILYFAIAFLLYANAEVVSLVVRAAAFLFCGALGGILGVGKKSKIRF